MLIAGDIGGTKTILRLVCLTCYDTFPAKPSLQTLYEQTYPSQQYRDLVPLVKEFLKEATIELKQSINVEKACFGIAGPVIDNTSTLTNLNWSLSSDRLTHDLSLQEVSLINDFAAIGYGILGLKQQDLCTLQEIEPIKTAPIALIGAGTGLGQAFMIPSSDGLYQVFNSEGGHGDFAPRSKIEFDLLIYIKEKFQIDRVSVERVVSGTGIATIYQFLRDQDLSLESAKMADIYRQWEEEIGKEHKTVNLQQEISKAAQNDQDYLCKQTMKLFIEAYGAEAGNLALKLLPYGGLYIAGGVAGKNLSLMQNGNFMEAFCAKGRMQKLMKKIPVSIITNPKVGLIGAAIRASLNS